MDQISQNQIVCLLNSIKKICDLDNFLLITQHSNQKIIKIPEYYLNVKLTPTRASSRQAEINAMRKNLNKTDDI